MEYAPIVGDKKLVFFSGGVDSLSSVVSYIDDKPQFFTVWGSDIPLGAEKEWEIVKQNALSFGQDRGLKTFLSNHLLDSILMNGRVILLFQINWVLTIGLVFSIVWL